MSFTDWLGSIGMLVSGQFELSENNFSASYEASEFCWQIALNSPQHLRPCHTQNRSLWLLERSDCTLMIMLYIDRIWKWLERLYNILALYGLLLCTEYYKDQLIIVTVLLFMKTISWMLWQNYSQCKTCDVTFLFFSLTPCCRRNFTLAFMKMLGACPGPLNHCQCI